MSALPPGRVWFGTWRAQVLTSISGPDAKTFALMSQYRGERADLAISLDVIYHLVEDRVFEDHMRTLGGSAHRSDLVVACSHALAEEVKRLSPAANVVAVWNAVTASPDSPLARQVDEHSRLVLLEIAD
jgi:hypothetical protein